MYRHQCQERVRYGQTDQMGYLYYGQYALLYEIGRTEAIRALGMPYKYMENELGIVMPVLKLEIRYLKPAFYDELLTIHTVVKERPTKLIRFEHEIVNESGEVINRGAVTLCFYHVQTQRMVRIPEALDRLMEPYFRERE